MKGVSGTHVEYTQDCEEGQHRVRIPGVVLMHKSLHTFSCRRQVHFNFSSFFSSIHDDLIVQVAEKMALSIQVSE